MTFIIEKFGLSSGYLLSVLFIFFRYALAAGLAFLFFYIIRKKKFWPKKIQQKIPKSKWIKIEIGHSLLTAFVFALVGLGIYGLRQLGLTKIYTDVGQYGAFYLLASFVLIVFIHDAYFYWMHRFMHHPRFFKLLHRVHHYSNNPTPWASLSFHPLEAFLEIAIIPVVVLLIPFHPLVLIAFASWSLLWNVIGHLGFELFPKGFVHHPIFRWINTSTHHNLHHQRSGCNYGLYFNIWDSWMGTNHPQYRAIFDEVKEREGDDLMI